jgi:hypothetical protein
MKIEQGQSKKFHFYLRPTLAFSVGGNADPYVKDNNMSIAETFLRSAWEILASEIRKAS